jgi:hypothetical protein
MQKQKSGLGWASHSDSIECCACCLSPNAVLLPPSLFKYLMCCPPCNPHVCTWAMLHSLPSGFPLALCVT